MAGLVRGRKHLAVAVDSMVISAAVTNCTTGAWKEERGSVQRSHHYLNLSKAQTHSALPEILVGCRHSVGGQRVCVHKVSPFIQVQLEQGPSGCQLEPSSYSTPSNTHAAMEQEELSCIQLKSCTYVCVCVCVCECANTFADWTAEMWVYDRVGAPDRRALLFSADNISTL